MEKYLYRQLAKASDIGAVYPGQRVLLNVDMALAHDGTGPALLEHWKKSGSKKIRCSKVLFALDHAFPAPTVKDRKFHKEFVEFSTELGCCLYKQGEGVIHQIIAEEQSLWPGMIIVGADGHVATAGAFGAIAFSVTPEKFIPVLESGEFETTVPEQVTVAIDGQSAENVLARDIVLYLVKELQSQIKGKAVALTGTLINGLSLAGKMSICNYLPEGGVVTAFVLPEGEDEKADYTIRAEEIEPLIALPPSPTNISRVIEVEGTVITAAIAGGCSAGRFEDMQIIADALAGKKVHPDVTFVVTPASRKVQDSMETSGISAIIRQAGAVIMPPGCGSCPGKHFGVLDDEDVAVATTIRNNPGRIGAEGARIHLASPLTVAVSAVTGKITVP